DGKFKSNVAMETFKLDSKADYSKSYIFTRPRKKEAAKKDKKHTELPSTPEMKTAPDSEGTAITPDNEPEKLQVPVPESQWTKPFKW
ncbi:hypothetical protein Tco_1179557, partial [Tanacetum coccineum]